MQAAAGFQRRFPLNLHAGQTLQQLKSERDNVDGNELLTARDIAKGWLEADASEIALALDEGLIQEVDY